MSEQRLVKQVSRVEWDCTVAKGKRMWGKRMEGLLSEYGLEEAAIEAESMSESQWKSVVDKRVEVVEQERFVNGIKGKSKLDLYGKFKSEIVFERYLEGFQRGGQRQMFKFRSGSSGLGEDRGHWKDRNYGTGCKVCGEDIEETREHVMFDCKGYEAVRSKWNVQMSEIVEGWGMLSTQDQLLLVLGQPFKGIRSGPQDKFCALRSAALNYLLVLWDERIESLYGASRYVPRTHIVSVPRLGSREANGSTPCNALH